MRSPRGVLTFGAPRGAAIAAPTLWRMFPASRDSRRTGECALLWRERRAARTTGSPRRLPCASARRRSGSTPRAPRLIRFRSSVVCGLRCAAFLNAGRDLVITEKRLASSSSSTHNGNSGCAVSSGLSEGRRSGCVGGADATGIGFPSRGPFLSRPLWRDVCADRPSSSAGARSPRRRRGLRCGRVPLFRPFSEPSGGG